MTDKKLSSPDKESKWTRTGHTIRNEETKERTVFKSINQAKKESRKIQMREDGALGRGCLRVE